MMECLLPWNNNCRGSNSEYYNRNPSLGRGRRGQSGGWGLPGETVLCLLTESWVMCNVLYEWIQIDDVFGNMYEGERIILAGETIRIRISIRNGREGKKRNHIHGATLGWLNCLHLFRLSFLITFNKVMLARREQKKGTKEKRESFPWIVYL
jgi:hypothetical protein